MPINSCSINAFTINSALCRRHSITPIPVIDNNAVQQHRYRNWVDPEHEYVNLEGLSIQVSVTIDDKVYSQTVDNTPDVITPMILISQFDISEINNHISVNNISIKRN